MIPGKRNLNSINTITMQNLNLNPDKKELRNFGLITGALTPVFFGLLLPWVFEHLFPKWPWIVGILLVLFGLALPITLKPVYKIWMTIGHYLGWINTRIILSIMFYLLILPVGVLMRMFGKDPMARSLNKHQQSYRVNSPAQDKNHVERPY